MALERDDDSDIEMESRPDDLNTEIARFLEDMDNEEFLEEAVLKGLLEKKDELVRIGMLESDIDVSSHVREIFGAFRLKKASCTFERRTDWEGLDESFEARDFRYLLQLAGQAVPITFTDWKVDRTHDHESALRLKNAAGLQRLLCEKYNVDPATVVDVDKGHGNGAMMKKMSRDGECRQVGVADKAAVFLIRDALEDFIKPWTQQTKYQRKFVESFLDLLSMLLGRELRQRWYEGDGNNIRNLRPKVPFFDLNEIFGLLANPAWIEKNIKGTKAKITKSIEFESDTEENLDLQSYIMLLRFQGKSEKEIKALISNHRVRKLVDSRTKAGKLLNQVLHYRRRLYDAIQNFQNRVRWYGENRRGGVSVFLLKSWAVEYATIVGKDKNFKCQTEEELLSLLDVAVEGLQGAIRNAHKQRSQKAMTAESPEIGGNKEEVVDQNPLQFLSEIFKEDFVRAVEFNRSYDFMSSQPYNAQACYEGRLERVRNGNIDLNEHAKFFSHRVVVSDFVNMDLKFPKNSCIVIRASRSDSHESDAEFKEDIRSSLPLLRPGGVLLTEGLRASYSRIRRFQEVKSIFDQDPELRDEYKLEILYDEETGEPADLMIQRAHPSGYLTDDEKRSVFVEGTGFTNIDVFLNNPYWNMIDGTRRRIFEIAGKNEMVFNKINDILERALDGLFFDFIAEKLKIQYCAANVDDLMSVLRRRWGAATDKFLKNRILAAEKGPIRGEVLLYPMEIEFIRTEFNALVVRVLEEQGRGLKSQLVQEPDLAVFAHSLHTIPRRGLPESGLNSHFVMPASALADNAELARPDAKEKLLDKINLLKGTLRDLRGLLGQKPILLIQFRDCDIGSMMCKKLQKILGDDFTNFVQVMTVSFAKALHGLLIEDISKTVRNVARFVGKGGIVLPLGSWVNSFDDFGRSYKYNIGRRIFDASQSTDYRVRVYPICFNHQSFADMIGETYFSKEMKTAPGALEIGGVTMDITAPEHPLFRDMPGAITVAMTHGGHVSKPAYLLQGENPCGFKFLANSGLTGLPVAYAARNIVSLQGHPEIDLVGEDGVASDVPEVLRMLRVQAEALKRTYDLGGVDGIGLNFKHLERTGKDDTPRVKANAGTHLIVNGLLYLADDLYGSLIAAA